MTLQNKALVVTFISAAIIFCTTKPVDATTIDSTTTDAVAADGISDKPQEISNQPEKKREKKEKSSSKKVTQAKNKSPKLSNKIDPEKRLALHEEKRTVTEINVEGNKAISKEAILYKLPVKIGDTFSVNETSSMIKNLYKMGYFHQIKIYAEPEDEDKVKLLIFVEEKPKLKAITFIGNKSVTEKDLKEAIQAENIISVTKQELKPLMLKIKKAYHKKSFHGIEVAGEIISGDDNTVSLEFKIKEGKKSFLNRISFKGNKHFPGKKLKRIIFSQEDWILSFMNHAGVYNAEMLEGDKYMIEDVYRNNGFVNAKVTNVDIQKDELGNHHLVFNINEGDRYRIKEINIEGNDIVSTERLKSIIPMYPGQIYSSENLRVTMENIRMLLGEFGYIFADIEPNVSIDEKDKTISIQFNLDMKDQVYLNRLTLIGNKKTRDKVVRRQIFLEEGEMITNQKMEVSKACVGLLGYFDPKGGVNWKTTRIDNTHADLDLMLKEVKTGHFTTNVSFGGTPGRTSTPATGLSANISFGDKNFLGSGIALATSTDISQRYKTFQASITNPWMFDKPIRGSLNGYIKSSEYDDQLTIAENPPVENAIGGFLGLGYVTKLLGSVMIDGRLQIENITYTDALKAAKRFSNSEQFMAQTLLDKYFQQGNQISLTGSLSQDKRNGTVFPTNGHQWNWFFQWTWPGWKRDLLNQPDCTVQNIANSRPSFNYIKTELDVSWYTPLIGEHDLVLCVHGNLGIIHPFKGKDVPWKNLYHIGGPQTIRGYLWGQVGPMWKGDSLGGTKGLVLNVEFIVPVTADLGTRAVIFYDGGAGWDSPYVCEFERAARIARVPFEREFTNNNFFYRHTIGIGMRMKSPSPIQIDFGIKLNPSKKYKKHLTEFHFSSDYSF
jgi:outer membrane protein insertion porin family